MKNYHKLLETVLETGVKKGDRTGTGTFSVFGAQMRFNLSQGFPLLTTKKIFWKGVVEELLWMISGSTNVRTLQERGVHIWDEWADKDGELGPVYGSQWRNWEHIEKHPESYGKDEAHPHYVKFRSFDQLSNVISRIKTNPDCRRLIVSAWNVAEIENMALPPCHSFFQFYVAEGKLSCHMYQRSADLFLGVPFNIASYSLLTHLVAHVTDLSVGDFIHSFGDAHIYLNHVDQVKELLSREHLPAPTLKIVGPKDIDQIKSEHIILENYKSHSAIKADVAI